VPRVYIYWTEEKKSLYASLEADHAAEQLGVVEIPASRWKGIERVQTAYAATQSKLLSYVFEYVKTPTKIPRLK
jgi:hypothetical protein